jgi:hypothetical protein
MNDEEKAAIDEIANSLQVITSCRRAFGRISASQRNRQSISKARRREPFAR